MILHYLLILINFCAFFRDIITLGIVNELDGNVPEDVIYIE